MGYLISIKHIPLESKSHNHRAYFVQSTASTTVEETAEDSDTGDPYILLEAMAEFLYENRKRNVGVVLQVHGFNTGGDYNQGYIEAAEAIQNIVKDQDEISVLYLGFVWPSEKFGILNGIEPGRSLEALPLWLRILLLLFFVAVVIFPLIGTSYWIANVGIALLGIFIGILPYAVVSLVILRLLVYFRDSYRAVNYGIPDFVQFFKALEYKISKVAKTHGEEKYWIEHPLGLTFIAHSMGAFVTTNLVRILIDINNQEDPGNTMKNYAEDNDKIASAQDSLAQTALETIDSTSTLAEVGLDQGKQSRISKSFELDKLILVSPDIPVYSILSGRANFLLSSLRRFKEAYLFSNEGDMILLLFSTAANYFIYPSYRSQMGYKLGNLGVLPKNIVEESEGFFPSVLNRLVIGIEHLPLTSEKMRDTQDVPDQVAKQFTYFDCTDYMYCKITGRSLNGKRLSLCDYVRLTQKGLVKSHVEYFSYPETKKAIYTLACKSFKTYYEELPSTMELGNDGIQRRVTVIDKAQIRILRKESKPQKTA